MPPTVFWVEVALSFKVPGRMEILEQPARRGVLPSAGLDGDGEAQQGKRELRHGLGRGRGFLVTPRVQGAG